MTTDKTFINSLNIHKTDNETKFNHHPLFASCLILPRHPPFSC